ncbi:MAG: radical SAM protein [Candidatus Zambryskibacteria bacterium]|nr:radical SAM protein [Candidatus Zambryskibacteria bacterium]
MTAWLTTNRSCNLRCNWCYAKMTNFDAKETMTLNVAERSIDFLRDLKLESVILIGGEPTVHPQFFRIVEKIIREGMKAYLVTNALRFSNRVFLKDAIGAGISAVTVSLKAVTAEDYKAFTGKDAFKRVRQAIHNLQDVGIPHVVNITACDSLVSNFDEVISFAKEIGIRMLSVDTGKPVVLEGNTHMDGMESPKRMAQFFMEIYPKLKQSGIRFSVKVAIPFCLFPRKFADMLIADGNTMTGCQMVSGRGIIIDPQGELVPCNHLCHLSLGGLGRDFSSAKEYVALRKRKDVIEFYDSVNSMPHNNCTNCNYWSVCGAGCKLYWLHYGPSDLISDFS